MEFEGCYVQGDYVACKDCVDYELCVNPKAPDATREPSRRDCLNAINPKEVGCEQPYGVEDGMPVIGFVTCKNCEGYASCARPKKIVPEKEQGRLAFIQRLMEVESMS